ncbi:hypothetical protein GCM10020001_057520 [Nonomuraea salmonea]
MTTPAEARVDLGAIRHNVALLKERAGGAQLMGAVKADAYGHGLLPTSEAVLGGRGRAGSAPRSSRRRSTCAPAG